MKKHAFALSKVNQLLETGPVVLVTTSIKGKPNVMAMAWHTMLDFDPPLLGCVVGEQSRSHKILKATGECVLNIPTVELAGQVMNCGRVADPNVDKFKKFKLTPVAASSVNAPLIDECYACLECKVIDSRLVKKYNFFIMRVVKAWIDPAVKDPRTIHHRGGNRFMVAGRTIKTSKAVK